MDRHISSLKDLLHRSSNLLSDAVTRNECDSFDLAGTWFLNVISSPCTSGDISVSLEHELREG